MNQNLLRRIDRPTRIFDMVHRCLCYVTKHKIGHIKRLEDKINKNFKRANPRMAG